MDKPKRLTITLPSWNPPIEIDDFLVAIGQKQSNSIYHVSEVIKVIDSTSNRTKKYHIRAYKSDLNTMLQRDEDQLLFTIKWDSRKTKHSNK